ncbi:hypothetical protein GR247_11025 [Rhizobium leguminosarum]|nr:hypothetical protein [Rhizobium leguminosarum]
MGSDRLLDAATLIGNHIAQQAFSTEHGCFWLSQELVPSPNGGSIVVRSSSFDLYGGATGVALFLADLAAATGDRAFKEIAIQAMHYSYWLAEVDIAHKSIGLFDGITGLGLASIIIGDLCSEPHLIEKGHVFLSGAIRESSLTDLDVISGVAGILVGLVSASSVTGTGEYHPAISKLANRLMESAGNLLRADPGTRRLTGYSHGVSGIALALLESQNHIGHREFDEIVGKLFHWENRTYDPHAKNWRDLRSGDASVPAFALAWCHGGPGIVMSQLRAAELGLRGLDAFNLQALDGLLDSVWPLIGSGHDQTLCHGLSGIGSIMRYAGERLNHAGSLTAARTILSNVCDAVENKNIVTPFGSKTFTAQLMTGYAGIGMYLLRSAGKSMSPTPLHFCMRNG